MSRGFEDTNRETGRRAGLSLQSTFLYRIAKSADLRAGAIARGNATWEMLAPGPADCLTEIGSFDVNLAVERVNRGDRCYLASLDGRLAHYAWVQQTGSHRIEPAGASVAVAAGELWIYHCHTAEWARGRGVYPATLARIVREHFDAGGTVAWIYTGGENVASQRGILKAGFQRVATMRALRLGTRYFKLGRHAD